MVYNNRVVLRMRYVVREQTIERFFFLIFADSCTKRRYRWTRS